MIAKSKILRSWELAIFCLFLALPVHCDPTVSELLDLKAKDNYLLINVAKSYPNVDFSYYENPPKLLISLLDAKYHKNFSFTEKVKQSVLDGIDFASDVSVGVVNIGEDKKKIGIILKLNNDTKVEPKVISKVDNFIKISLVPKVGDRLIKELTSQDESLDFTREEIRAIYNQAVEKHLSGDIDNAEKLYNEVISKDIEFYLARFNLAKLYLDTERYDEAIFILRDLVNNLSTSSKNISELTLMQNTLGTAYYLKGEYEEALKEFNEVLARDPNSCSAYYNLGLVYEKLKKIEQSKSNFQKLIDLCKTNEDIANAYYHLSVINLILKNKDEAQIGFQKVIELFPDSKVAKLSKDELNELQSRKRKLFK